jgi:chemotaxis protein CheD
MTATLAQCPAEVVLQAGDYFFGEAPTLVRTLLGSCIAITLWDPKTCRGGMVHCLLPSRGGVLRTCGLSGRFVDEGLRWLLREAVRTGVDPGQCTFKLFGGSNMFAAFGLDHGRRVPIGEANAIKARSMMQGLGLTPRVVDVGGSVHRSLVFDLSNGDVWVRYGKYDAASASKEGACA